MKATITRIDQIITIAKTDAKLAEVVNLAVALKKEMRRNATQKGECRDTKHRLTEKMAALLVRAHYRIYKNIPYNTPNYQFLMRYVDKPEQTLITHGADKVYKMAWTHVMTDLPHYRELFRLLPAEAKKEITA